LVKLVVGMNEVFDNFVRYLRKAYPMAHDIKLTYFQLGTDKEGESYRGEVEFRANELENETTSAIFRANIENGKIYFYQEGYHWEHKT